MLKIRYSSRLKKHYKSISKRGYEIMLLKEVLNLLVQEKALPQNYLDHPLLGDYAGHRECHLTPDWLLIYKIEKDIKTLSLTRTGTHSELY